MNTEAGAASKQVASPLVVHMGVLGMGRLAVVLALGLAASSARAEATATSGKLVKAQGQVFVRPPNGTEAAAQSGTQLVPGTQIRTGADGNAEVQFDDGSLLKVTPSTSIVLSPTKRQQKKNSVLLFFGRVWSKVSPSKTGDANYEVQTPNAVCGVRGTEFETQVADDGSVRMQVKEGKVAVDGEDKDGAVAGAGQQVEANETGVDDTESSSGQQSEEAWRKEKGDRLNSSSESIVKSLKGKVMSRKDKMAKLVARQKELESKRTRAEERARAGEEGAIDEIKKYNKELAEIADAVADLGDEAAAQVGAVDHFADLANDPRFRGINRKYLEAEAASLRRVKADLDKMVADGTDISIQAMDKLLEDMGSGKGRGKLKDNNSAADDLFGDDPMKMK